MKVNGIQFINDNWHFYGIGNASYVLKIDDEHTLSVQTKRDRTTPFEVSFIEHKDKLPFLIPKCKDWEFLSDREFGLYLADQAAKIAKYIYSIVPVYFLKSN